MVFFIYVDVYKYCTCKYGHISIHIYAYVSVHASTESPQLEQRHKPVQLVMTHDKQLNF